MEALQLELSMRGRTMSQVHNLKGLAILQIIVPDESHLDMAKKITDGIGLPEADVSPIRVVFSLDPIPPNFVPITNIVYFVA